jgi:hypothetical protein
LQRSRHQARRITPDITSPGTRKREAAKFPYAQYPSARTTFEIFNLMNKTISLALLVVGAILIIYGINANDSTASGFHRFFTGNPTDKTMWLLIGGAVAAAIGAGGLFRGSRTP